MTGLVLVAGLLLSLPEADELAKVTRPEVGRAVAARLVKLLLKHHDRPIIGETLARLRRLPVAHRPMGHLCVHLQWAGAPRQAQAVCAEALATGERGGVAQAELAPIRVHYARALYASGELTKAEAALAPALPLLADDNPVTGLAYGLRVHLALDRGQLSEAVSRAVDATSRLQGFTPHAPNAVGRLVRATARMQAWVLGDQDLARRMLETALEILDGHPAHSLRALLLSDLALIKAQRDPAEALDLTRRAVDAVAQAKVIPGEALIPALLAYGRVVHQLHRPEYAVVELSQVDETVDHLQLAELVAGAFGGEGAAIRPWLMAVRASLLHDLDRLAEAAKGFDDALGLLAAQPDNPHRAAIYQAYADHAEAMGELPLAIWAGKHAIEALAYGEAASAGLGGEHRAAWLEAFREPFEVLAERLVAAGRLAEAQAVLGRLKATEFERFTRGGERELMRVGRTQAEARLEARLKVVRGPAVQTQRALQTLRSAQAQAMLKGQALGPDAKARLALAREAAQLARRQWLATLEAASDALKGRDAKAAPPREALEALQATLKATGGDAAILQVLVTPQHTYLLLTTADALVAKTVDVTAATLNAEVAELRRRVANRRALYRDAAKAVYRRIIGPVRAELNAAKVKTLVVSLDGALRYVPLAALVDPATGRHLVERFALARYHDAARGQLERPGAAEWTVAGLGVSEAKAGFTPLPEVKTELEAIVRKADDDPDGVAQGIVRLDAAFDRDTLAAALSGPFPGVHVASHFQFNPGVDQSSFLLLGDGGKLTVADLWAGSFDFKGVDLLVLSACETGVDGGDGREVDGLAGVVQRRGVRSVVASLWPVADASTAQLMQRFYTELTAGTRRGAALRTAQLAFLKGEGQAKAKDVSRATYRADDKAQGFIPDPARPYAHPYYWAPFVLMGAWR